mmetsp:Transcript_5027/g.12872  ORF Transcript_5027/g.12872 Transcript_5027/m.12872 type:complete len:405 (+) Transcript_5027:149-1363(+)
MSDAGSTRKQLLRLDLGQDSLRATSSLHPKQRKRVHLHNHAQSDPNLNRATQFVPKREEVTGRSRPSRGPVRPITYKLAHVSLWKFERGPGRNFGPTGLLRERGREEAPPRHPERRDNWLEAWLPHQAQPKNAVVRVKYVRIHLRDLSWHLAKPSNRRLARENEVASRLHVDLVVHPQDLHGPAYPERVARVWGLVDAAVEAAHLARHQKVDEAVAHHFVQVAEHAERGGRAVDCPGVRLLVGQDPKPAIERPGPQDERHGLVNVDAPPILQHEAGGDCAEHEAHVALGAERDRLEAAVVLLDCADAAHHRVAVHAREVVAQDGEHQERAVCHADVRAVVPGGLLGRFHGPEEAAAHETAGAVAVQRPGEHLVIVHPVHDLLAVGNGVQRAQRVQRRTGHVHDH